MLLSGSVRVMIINAIFDLLFGEVISAQGSIIVIVGRREYTIFYGCILVLCRDS